MNAIRNRTRDERGMTMIEVVVAALILIMGSLAVLTLVDTAAKSTYRAEQGQVVSDRLQQELEEIKNLPYDEVALTGLPADTSNTAIPSWRVSGSSFASTQTGGGMQPLVVNGGALYAGGTIAGGVVNPAPETFDSGDISGTIYRFVTWEDDPSCPASQCPGTQDLKRVVVAVRLDPGSVGGVRKYQELQAQITDPEVEPVDNENPIDSGEDDAKPWTFFLTDTPCNNTTRQPITADHLTHNTRGYCSAGQKSGNDPGAPDLMFTEAPPFETESPIFDYATDVEPTQNPAGDRGLQLVRGTSSGCDPSALGIATVPEADLPTRFQELHKWLSPPLPAGSNVTIEGAYLNLWTQTINASVHTARLCVWLFVRSASGTSPVDTPMTSLGGLNYFTYEEQWPVDWGEIEIPLEVQAPPALTEGLQLGVAIAVEKDGTSGGGLQFMYDEPSFDSRLEVKSTSTLPTF